MGNMVGSLGGSTVDDMLKRMRTFEAMSPNKRNEFVRAATRHAGRVTLSESDLSMTMGADGYFDET